MLKAVLFDLDGVLVDACELHRRALNFALMAVTGYEIPRNEFYLYEGRSTRVKLNMLVGLGYVPADKIDEINELKQRTTLRLARELFTPDKPKMYLMGRLKQAGLKIGVVSNAVSATVHRFLDYAGLFEYVDYIVSNEDVKKTKPDPEGYLTAMEHFNVKPEETIILEDSEVGIAAAKATGATVVKVSSVSQVNWELLRCRVN